MSLRTTLEVPIPDARMAMLLANLIHQIQIEAMILENTEYKDGVLIITCAEAVYGKAKPK
jgi:hypothetical protein